MHHIILCIKGLEDKDTNFLGLYFAYSDALKNSFFPRTIPLWNSLPSSVVSSKTIEEFKGLI